MKIIISGYGRMGKEIEKAAISSGHSIEHKIDNSNDWELLNESKTKADVVIDFSFPEVAVTNIINCFHLDIPIVSGTTGWYESIDEVKQLCEKTNGTLFFAPNFSIGVNLFFRINKQLAKMMSAFSDYQVSMKEIHHIHKLDAPSGTAIKAAEDIVENSRSLKGWEQDDPGDKSYLQIESVREGEVPGTHSVCYESSADTLELKHEAKNRTGFANGAILAASWLQDKRGVYTMDDMLKSMI